jgi:hypothetical protein
MKIEADKYYKTRDGSKVFVAAIVHNPFVVAQDQPVYGFIDTGYADNWGVDGRYFEHDAESSLDLISEWKEPVVVKRYVAWVRDDYGEVRPWCGQPHHSREAAEDSCDSLNYELLRIDEISYTE